MYIYCVSTVNSEYLIKDSKHAELGLDYPVGKTSQYSRDTPYKPSHNFG